MTGKDRMDKPEGKDGTGKLERGGGEMK